MIRAANNTRRKKIYTDIFPPLQPDAYEALKRSIAEIGVQEPVVEDEKGGLIDGRHRRQATEELGLQCPKIIRLFASEAEKFELALRLNCQRRQLNRQQKRSLIEAYLRADQKIADNALADIIGGISKNTVAEVRSQLEATRQIDKLAKTRGKDGKLRPRNYARIVANTAKEADAARKAIKDLPDSCEGKIVDATTAARRARRNVKKQVRDAQAIEPLGDGDIQLHHCRFQDLEQVAGISPATVNLLHTDIPYGQDFLPHLPDLAALAERLLVDGGLLAMLCGHSYLPQYVQTLGECLTYRWTMATAWCGDVNVIHPLQIASQWKPVLVYSKGQWIKRRRWSDLIKVDCKEKDRHRWQQPLEQTEWLVRYLSDPGDLVIDPCGGSFTTAVACKRLGRRFIGCDVDEACVRTGWERLASQKEQTATGTVAV